MVGTARVGRLPGRLIKGAGMILKIVFLLLLLASPCFAQQQMAMNVAVIGAGTAAAAGCTTSNDSSIIDKTGVAREGDSGHKTGLRFTIVGTYTITQYVVNLTDWTGDDTGSTKVSIWSSTGSEGSETINSMVTGTDVTVANTGLETWPTYTLRDFTLSTPKTGLSAGTYFVVVENAGGGTTKVQHGPSSGDRMLLDDTSYVGNYAPNIKAMGCAE
jgi:hypothetical protein